MWRYGGVELAFAGDRLAAIRLRAAGRLPARLRLLGWPDAATTLRQFQRYLAGEDIPYRMAPAGEDRILLHAGRDVTVLFLLDGTHTSLHTLMCVLG